MWYFFKFLYPDFFIYLFYDILKRLALIYQLKGMFLLTSTSGYDLLIPVLLFGWYISIIISLLASFYHQHWLVVFNGRPSDSKSPRVSSTHLCTLSIFSNTVIYGVSILPLISVFSISPFQTFRDRAKCTNYNWYHVTLMLHSFFS